MVDTQKVGIDIGCFTGDTEVWCSGGFYKTIKELAEQNKTFLTDAWDEENHAFVITSATAFKTRSNADLVKVTYKKETTFKNQECKIQVRGFVITTEGSWDKPTKKYCEDCGAKMDGDSRAV